MNTWMSQLMNNSSQHCSLQILKPSNWESPALYVMHDLQDDLQAPLNKERP